MVEFFFCLSFFFLHKKKLLKVEIFLGCPLIFEFDINVHNLEPLVPNSHILVLINIIFNNFKLRPKLYRTPKEF